MKKKEKSLGLLLGIVFLVCSSMISIFSMNYHVNLGTQGKEDDRYIDPLSSSSEDDYNFEWNASWGIGYDDKGTEVATDSSNNVYLVGYSDTTGSDNCDIKIFKYTPSGVELWSRNWGGGNDDKAKDIYIDESDNIYVVGNTKSLGDSDGDIVVIKFDTSGNEIWNLTWGGTLFEYGSYIMKDSSNNFYVVGQTTSFGDTTGDVLIIKFNQNFEEQWNRTWGGGEPDIANKIEEGSDGYLYIVGHSDSVDSHAGYSDVVLLKYDENGNYQWERTWGTSYDQRGSSLALDSNDNIYITGHSFGHPASSGKGFLLKYDSSGTYQWERIWGFNGVYGNYFYRIIIDDKDDLYISGCTKSYGISNNYDTLLLNYDTSGNQNWFKYWTGIGFDVSPGICMDLLGNIYLAGHTDTYSAGGYDMLLLKYANTVEILAPLITINQPEFGDIFVDISPLYSITIDETALDSFWYSLDDGQTNHTISELTGAIDQSAWDSIPDGHVTLIFYAKDETGNIGQNSVLITKRTTASYPGIPGYNIILLVGVSFVVTLIILKKKVR